MRKVLTIAVAVTMVLVFVGTVHAAEDSWRISLAADDGAGMGGAPSSHLGVAPTSNDYAPADAMDLVATYGLDITQSTIWAVGNITDGNTYARDIKAGDLALPKVWTLCVAALPESTYPNTRLTFATISGTTLQPPSVGGSPVEYELTMVNNRVKPGAPANGTVWTVPIMSSHPSSFVIPDLFPTITLSAGNHAAMLAEGYVLSFTQASEVIPEPSSLLALGTGLSGLVGFIIRRRRA